MLASLAVLALGAAPAAAPAALPAGVRAGAGEPAGRAATSVRADRPDTTSFLAVRHDGTGYGLADDLAALREQVREPLFAFVFLLTEADSLGTWTADDLLTFADRWGEPSDFPVAEHLESLTREALPPGEVLEKRGARCRRRWLVRLRPATFEMPMPYSILGYHPGKLSFQSPIELREWRVGDADIHVRVEDASRRYAAAAVTVWQVAAGWIILDVDGWLDTLLGNAADDAAMEGFTVGWVDGELVGVGNSAGRDGRRILGELDFRSGEVAAHGRAVARGLSHFTRTWTRERGHDPRTVWRAYEGD